MQKTTDFVSERGKSLILAANILDRPNADPDDDLAILARQLTRCAEENDRLRLGWHEARKLLRELNRLLESR